MSQSIFSSVAGLAALEARLQQDLAWLDLPAKSWVPPLTLDGQPVLDVAVIGGGQAGMAAAVSLNHIGIGAVIFDQSPAGFEGPWATTARMETLRSPKKLTGPALGFGALTFRAWFEAQFGLEAWEALDKIPRLQWMDYLRWYRRVLALDVRNQHRVEAILPRADGVVELRVATPAGVTTVLARRVVLATGRDGLGGAYLPSFASDLPRRRWAHSADDLDYSSLAGLRVGVIGAGASAMDSAATALEAGAAKVDLLIRRKELPRVNKGKGAGNPGLTNGHLYLPDEWKWRIRHYINVQQTPPPSASVQRVSKFPNARFILGAAINDIAVGEQGMRVSTTRGVFDLDFLIFSTGFRIDWTIRPEFAAIAPHIRNWSDRYTPPAGDEDAELADSPDLGMAFEFQQKQPGGLPGLKRVHCFCYPAALSHGSLSGDIPAISDGAQRLAQGIAALLYRENIDTHYLNMQNYNEPELLGDEWLPAEPTSEERR
ncbi:FAD binding domain protein [Collimonas arenae]|uniref:FAD binding domain protein n=1 Tax=Collimonas arenae TaxID=279058 RepID=A0A127PR37_9BURK|nr:NAD(P)/FAD-dependent oxidoreductase [Collimonas arenae]AMP00236.1 FAD binding domain protein [Collimonas arenae]AMP10111.1 FAD binding domain protein [Collimonas arenae]